MLMSLTIHEAEWYVVMRGEFKACRGLDNYLKGFDIRCMTRDTTVEWYVAVHEHDLDQAIAVTDATLATMIEQQSERNEQYA